MNANIARYDKTNERRITLTADQLATICKVARNARKGHGATAVLVFFYHRIAGFAFPFQEEIDTGAIGIPRDQWIEIGEALPWPGGLGWMNQGPTTHESLDDLARYR